MQRDFAVYYRVYLKREL